jgi:peroxiredoxin Q/BCP
MAQLRQAYPEIRARNAEVVVVGPEGPAEFRDFWQREEYPFVGIPDPDHNIAGDYGQQVRLLKWGRLPALVVVDRAGNMRFQHHGDSMQDLTPSEELLAVLDEINQSAPA